MFWVSQVNKRLLVQGRTLPQTSIQGTGTESEKTNGGEETREWFYARDRRIVSPKQRPACGEEKYETYNIPK